MNTSTIMMTPLKTRRFAIAMIESTKQARNNGPEMKRNAGDTKSRITPTNKHKNDQREGFHSFFLEAIGV